MVGARLASSRLSPCLTPITAWWRVARCYGGALWRAVPGKMPPRRSKIPIACLPLPLYAAGATAWMLRSPPFPFCAARSKPSRNGWSAASCPFSVPCACLGLRSIPVCASAGPGLCAAETNFFLAHPPSSAGNPGEGAPSLTLGGVDAMGADLERLKQRIPLLEYLQRHHWTGHQVVGTRSEFVGL